MADKAKDPAPSKKIRRALEHSLLQEVILFDVSSSEGKYSHSEVIQFCLN
jgi:hypothetical protein